MTRIREQTIVDCPPKAAYKHVLDYLNSLRHDGGPTTLRLTASIGARTGSHASIARDAIAVFQPVSAASALEYKILIDWAPSTREPLPKFDGVFRLQWDEEYGKSRLVIEGQYEPPLGVVGKAFDAVAGQAIAKGTMTDLLRQIRDAIETGHRADLGK